MASLWSKHGLIDVRPLVARLRGYAAVWLRAFGRSDIDLSLRTHPGLVTRIVERPGLSLPQAELDALLAQLRIVAGKTLPAGSLTYGLSPKGASVSRAPSSRWCRTRPPAIRSPSMRSR